jgi:SAM-dependent methyltransferase
MIVRQQENEANWIQNASYPDLVAFMQQDNAPPGGQYTLEYWIDKGNIKAESVLLDLACSTGFSSRYCYERLKARAEGIDVSALAISTATQKASELNTQNLNYQVADACALPFADESFTHVLGGCNFAFIEQRGIALTEVMRVLKREGTICTANYFYRIPPPTGIVEGVYDAIGFRPNPTWGLEFWNKFYNSADLQLEHEVIHHLESQDDDALFFSIEKYISDENKFTSNLDIKSKGILLERFLGIRRQLNAQRDYQGVALQIWRKK